MTTGSFRRPLRNLVILQTLSCQLVRDITWLKVILCHRLITSFQHCQSNAISSSMVYSPSVDGVFCKHCALMIPMHCRKDKGAFVNKPFINWHKLQEKAKNVSKWSTITTQWSPLNTFLILLKTQSEQPIKWQEEEECVSEAIFSCGRQCIALRGDNEVLKRWESWQYRQLLGGSAANHDDICMGQERRSSLVLMHCDYQVKIDLDEVVNLFATKHPQRLELGTILKD